MADAAATPPEIRVLVVDDHAGNLALLSEVVDATQGFTTVAAAASGELALEWLKPGAADLVLIDVRMPGLGGVATARRIARRARRPVVFLFSGDDRPDIAADPQAFGAEAFIRKDALSSRMLRHVWASYVATAA